MTSRLNIPDINWLVSASAVQSNPGQNLTLDASGNSSNVIITTDSSNVATFGSNTIAGTTYNKSLNVNGPYFTNGVSATQIAADSSNNRPYPGQSGYIRYNTTTHFLEYWNSSTNSWISLAQPPIISSINPNYVPEDSSLNYTITGNFFSAFSSVSFIGFNDLVVYPAFSTTFISDTQLTTINTLTMSDASINAGGFFVRVTNTDTNLSYTSPTPLLSYNQAPLWISPSDGVNLGTGISEQTYTYFTTPFTDLSAIDINIPVTFISSGSLPSGVSLDPSGRLIGTMPNVLSPTTYTLTTYPQDSSGVVGPIRNFPFTVTPKFISLTYSGEFLTSTYSSGGYTYRYVVWRPPSNTTSNSTYTNAIQINYTSGIAPFNQIDFLIIGGGGGGGAGWQGGGGGAGGLISSTTSLGGSGGGGAAVGPYLASVGNFSIVVGGGGAGGNYSTSGSNTAPVNGGNSTLFGYTANGGGRGAGEQNLGTPSLSYSSTSGGSGGAGSHGGSTTGSPSNGVPTQGNSGGNGISSGSPAVYNGGGGGGAGSIGGSSTLTPDVAGSGGSGLSNSITGSSVTYAGGGGGASRTGAAGVGGTGGGGNGGANASGSSGTVGTGGGGGSASSSSGGFAGQVGGTGGTGIVIIRYIIA